MAIMNNDRRSFGARERDDAGYGSDERRGGSHDWHEGERHEGGRYEGGRYEGGRYEGGRYGGGSDRRFGSDYGDRHYGQGGGGREGASGYSGMGGRHQMNQEDRWHRGGRNHDERRGGGVWYGGRDDDDRRRGEYGGGRYGMDHYDNNPQGGRYRGGGYGEDEGYGGGSMQRERDFDRSIGNRGGGRGWYGGEQSGGGMSDGRYGGSDAASGGYPQRGDAMSMGAGLGRGSGMTGKGPKGYTRSDDRIKEDVCDCLTDDHHVDASSIEVQVRNGEVTLGGTVDSRETKRRAEDLVERASGVKHVQNNLRVQTGSDAGGSDTGKRTGTGHTTSSIIT